MRSFSASGANTERENRGRKLEPSKRALAERQTADMEEGYVLTGLEERESDASRRLRGVEGAEEEEPKKTDSGALNARSIRVLSS